MKVFTKRVLLFFLLFSLCLTNSFAQFDSQISQYQIFPSVFNPAMVGETGRIQIAGMQRVEFFSFASGGQATNFAINAPIMLGNSFHGLGFRLANRKIGSVFKYQNAYLQYSYKLKLAGSRLCIGADFGFVNVGIDGTKVSLPENSEYHLDDDNKIPKTDISGIGFDLNLGFAYLYENLTLALSYAHVSSPLLQVGETNSYKLPPILYIYAMYRYQLSDRKIVLCPSSLFKTYFSNFDLDIGARCVYDEKIWGGLSYRFQNSVVFSAGMDFGAGISASLAYDLPTTRMIASFGSLELFLEYGLERTARKQKKKYKSVRIL